MSVEETLRRRRAKQAAPAEVPLIRPLRGTFSPSKAGEKGNAGGASIERGRRSSFSLRPTQWGEGAPEGRMRGSSQGSAMAVEETLCRRRAKQAADEGGFFSGDFAAGACRLPGSILYPGRPRY